MPEQNPIRYQDLITPDDSIEKLISQLQELQKVYTGMVNEVKTQAETLASSLTKVSGANEKGRKSISTASEDAKRLEKAYKQLDAALSANAKDIARLNAVRREANNYNKQMVLRGKEEIATRKQIKEASYQQLSAQYSLNKAYINSLTATDRLNAKNKELIKTTKEIYEQMKKLQADTGKMQLNVGNYPMLGGLLGGLGGKALGLGGAASAGMALASVVKNNVELARDYEKALSVLAAILGTTKEGIKELDAQAQQLGATTTFTASEVAELQTELAKLGYSVKEITNMAPAILNFSQATGASLADAASLAGAALRMFEKDSEDTTEFVDKMSAATTKSALNFSYLQNAMSTVAPVANAFGFQLEDVLALLGQLANAGFDASSAATATRNILLNLADANGKLAQALGEPVTTLDDLINGLQELNDRGIDLGESLELTDKRSVAAFNTFLSGVDKVRQLRDELQKCDGWAAKMGDTMNNNLAGSLKQLESAWEGFNLHINQSNGLLRKMVDWLTLAVNNLDKMLKRLEAYYQIAKTFKNKLFGGGSSAETPFVSPEDYPTFDIFKPNEPKGNKPQGNKPTGGIPTGGNTLRTQEQQQKEMLDLRRKYEDAMTELIEDEDNRQYVQMQNKYNREIADLQATLEKKKAAKQLSLEDEKLYNQQIAALTEVRDKKLNDLVDKQNDKLKQDREKKKREEEQAKQQSIRMQERAIQLQYETEMEGIEQLETSEKEKTRMRLEAEKKRLTELLKLYQADGKKLADEEIKLIKKQIEGVDQELEKNKKRDNDLYDVLGFKLTDEKKEAIDTALNYSLEAVNQWVSSLSAAADKERELADAQVDRAQNVLEKEIEARNNGYANDVETARKELELAKKNQQKAIDQQRRAQRIQIALDTASQAANLITASSLIWKQLGFPWAIPALAVMWGSFAAAKVQALSAVNAGTEKYGEGTVELLEGGSHQSGNDIDLGRKSNGTRRRAEGGEFFAVINKRNSRKYRDVIPDVINSLNQGTFAEKYLNAYDGGGVSVVAPQGTNLSRVEAGIDRINDNLEKPTTFVDKNGNMVTIYKNVKRVIKS
jgi:TP901 family phage tail tape measure protein